MLPRREADRMTIFTVAALVLVMMPGPDQVFIARNVLAGGRTVRAG